MSDIYIFYYVVDNCAVLLKNLHHVKVEKYGKDVYVKLYYNNKVIKYFYKFSKAFESEKYFYNISMGDFVEVKMKLDFYKGSVVENIYKGGNLFVPDTLFFHINKKTLAANNGSQGLFYSVKLSYIL